MPDLTKIATCSFCGSRSVLRLREVAGHQELTCNSCAAPLHEMKPLKVPQKQVVQEPVKERVRTVYVEAPSAYKPKKKRYRRPARLKRIFSNVVEELFDELEDIFD